MEINKIEVATIEKTVNEAMQNDINELDHLQLALVGGGIGTVVIG